MPNSVKCLLEVYEDMAEISLMLELLLTKGAQTANLQSGTPTLTESCLFLDFDVVRLGSQSIEDDPEHHLDYMAD